MSIDPDHRADALARIAGAEERIGALEAEAERLREDLAAARAAVEAIPEPAAEPDPAPPAVPAASGGDVTGARIVALDLVLRGVPRDEAVLRLAADFPGVDVAALLDEAAARG